MKHRYIVPRLTQPEFDQMNKIYDWCESAFDKKADYWRWSVNFARNTENFVEFSFRDEADASAFVFQWNEYCVSKEKQWELGLSTWDEV